MLRRMSPRSSGDSGPAHKAPRSRRSTSSVFRDFVAIGTGFNSTSDCIRLYPGCGIVEGKNPKKMREFRNQPRNLERAYAADETTGRTKSRRSIVAATPY